MPDPWITGEDLEEHEKAVAENYLTKQAEELRKQDVENAKALHEERLEQEQEEWDAQHTSYKAPDSETNSEPETPVEERAPEAKPAPESEEKPVAKSKAPPQNASETKRPAKGGVVDGKP